MSSKVDWVSSIFKSLLTSVVCVGIVVGSNLVFAKTKETTRKATATKSKKKESKKKNTKTKGKEIVFSFPSIKLKLKITKGISAASGVEFSNVEARDEYSAVLNFATPNLKDQATTRVPALVLTEFEGEETLKHDVRELGYANEARVGDGGIPRQLPLPRGYLYFWTTPTMGSANYYYLQHPQDKNIAIRIGPIPSAIDKDFTIDWAGARWSK